MAGKGDYLIPCLTIPAEEEQPIGIWGQRHLDYLKQYRKVTYTTLLTSGRLNAYLTDIDKQAKERFEKLIEGMKQAQGGKEKIFAAFEIARNSGMEQVLVLAMKLQKSLRHEESTSSLPPDGVNALKN